jgi:ribosomal 50S subunit-recycling heat shock protein
MRLDQFLKATHLVKRRELAKELCEDGCVRINGSPRKPSAEVSAGDVLEFPVYNRLLKVRVLDVPRGATPKGSQWSFIEVLEEKRFPVDEGSIGDQQGRQAKATTYH